MPILSFTLVFELGANCITLLMQYCNVPVAPYFVGCNIVSCTELGRNSTTLIHYCRFVACTGMYSNDVICYVITFYFGTGHIHYCWFRLHSILYIIAGLGFIASCTLLLLATGPCTSPMPAARRWHGAYHATVIPATGLYPRATVPCYICIICNNLVVNE